MAFEGSIGTDPIPFRIASQAFQSGSEFFPTNGMPDDSGMHDTDLIRNNIRHLLNIRGLSETEAAEKAGINQPWLNRYLRKDIKKANQEKVTQIAKALGVSAAELAYSDLTGLTEPPASQPVGSERAIVEAAVRLVRELEAMSPDPQSEDTYAERLYIAMKFVRDEGMVGVIDETALMPALRKFAAELRKTG
ncbi:TPA: helix-turn-helix transcriptional regulator [Stenotrophomonas maltophilia]|nr:helix-turn-helix transcriptional regulator [Stenotrophomonas maltophilia]